MAAAPRLSGADHVGCRLGRRLSEHPTQPSHPSLTLYFRTQREPLNSTPEATFSERPPYDTGPGPDTGPEPDPEAGREADDGPEIIIAPAVKGAWGVVTATSGPQQPPPSRHPKLAGADALLRRGMVALDKSRPRRLDEAEVCFRQALDLLKDVLDHPHPRISYALDRIGLTCHLRGRLREAEALYLRSLAVLDDGRSPTKWNDMTILNLAILYGQQGRREEQEAVMRLYEP